MQRTLLFFKFKEWLLDGSSQGSSPSISVYMKSDHEVVAKFVYKEYKLSLKVTDEYTHGTSGCRINLHPPGGDYADGDSISYRSSTEVEAKPASRFYYDGVWISDCSGGYYRFIEWKLDGKTYSTNPLAPPITMRDDHKLEAVFHKQAKLYIKIVDGYTGNELSGCTVNLNPSPNFSDGSTLLYDLGESITATAPLRCGEYRFDHWEFDGSDQGTTPTIHFVMDSDHTVITHFRESAIPPTPTLRVPVAAPVYKGCVLPLGFPWNMNYKGCMRICSSTAISSVSWPGRLPRLRRRT